VGDFDDCLHDVQFAGRLIDVAPPESEELTRRSPVAPARWNAT
jgi:hypothetical protein